jgi:ABC-2 type transport system ATP-binding protein
MHHEGNSESTTSPIAASSPGAPGDDRVILRVEQFGKTYQGVQAVRGLSFEAHAGQVLGMVGPNGAGKTTTMRSIAGVIPPSDGRLAVGGCDLAHDPIGAKRKLAYVPDDPHLFEALTVWEHLEFVAEAYRVDDFVPKAERLISQFELTEKRDTPAQELSRGMRQKTAICCAYLHDPLLLMLDEPMTGLDPRGIRTMKQTLIERASAGAAVIVSSHLLTLVEDMCSHLLVLHRGRLMFHGSIDEARAMMADVEGGDGAGSTLEEVFFRITEGDANGASEGGSDSLANDEEATGAG